ncbi:MULTISPECIES: antibiotic biosynthesis monooxygenase family protein [Falsihalocynthiibacter]|uniref:antibiotic biosynthesis monooxygenase family protein n=1 Tax=Falsihalocynthiibacter TaxID=2854182 RepID=UPI003002D915
MTQHTIETVTFKLNDGVTREAFAKAAKAITDFARKQEGFVSRRLSCSDDGLWIEHVEWETLEAAQAAGAQIGNEPSLEACMKAIDGPSVVLHHTTLEISVN